MAKKLKVRKVTPGEVDQELVIDASELTEDETVEEEIDTEDETEVEVDSEDESEEDEVPSTEEGEGDGPKTSGDESDDDEDTDSENDDASEVLEDVEQELITLLHTVKNGTLCLARRTYEIVEHEVKVLAEDFQDCIHHGLTRKE